VTAFTPGVPSALSPLVRRIVAPNPSPMTGQGTNTYLVGIDEVAVIDPGPDIESHVDAIVGASMRERVRWVLLTHGHPDHAPATTRLVEATGAEVLAFSRRDAGVAGDRGLADGDVVEGTEFRLEAVHTPGHAPDHVCFHLDEERLLFSGDMILGGTYSVVSPPGGGDRTPTSLRSASCAGCASAESRAGHGYVIERPRACIDDYIRHREDRERQILAVLDDGPARVPRDRGTHLRVHAPGPARRRRDAGARPPRQAERAKDGRRAATRGHLEGRLSAGSCRPVRPRLGGGIVGGRRRLRGLLGPGGLDQLCGPCSPPSRPAA